MIWTDKLDSLARYLYPQEELQTWNKPEPAKSPRSPSPAATRTPERVSVVTLELNPRDGETELLFRHEGFFDEKARDNHEKGWSGLLGQLQAHLQRS